MSCPNISCNTQSKIQCHYFHIQDVLIYCQFVEAGLTLNLLTTTIVAPPSNASKWQMGFKSAFKGLKENMPLLYLRCTNNDTNDE